MITYLRMSSAWHKGDGPAQIPRSLAGDGEAAAGGQGLLSHAPIVSEWHVAAVSGERVVDADLFRASVFRYLLMVSTSLSTSFVAVRTPLEDMFLAFRRLACDMPRSVNSGATIELSVCCRRCARQGAELRSIGGVARRCALYGRTT